MPIISVLGKVLTMSLDGQDQDGRGEDLQDDVPDPSLSPSNRSEGRGRGGNRSHSRSRSRSVRRHKHKRKSRHHRRSRSSSRSRSRSSSRMRRYINQSLSSALQPLQQQIANLSSPSSSSGSAEFQELRRQQQELAIENKAASLSSAGAKSQYRCLAAINLNLSHAVEAIDDLLISRSSPDDPVYQALSPIRNSVSSSAEKASERIDLIFKADQEPKSGWKALSLYDEKKLQGNSDPEKHKVWASCLKAVQETQKKSIRPSPQPQPFRQQPGWNPGRSSYSGGVGKSLLSVKSISFNIFLFRHGSREFQ